MSLAGKKVLVTAGPTYEPIDPVRFIGNRSSGKMGIAICEALILQGAEVTLVLGPTSLAYPVSPLLKVIDVASSDQMYDTVMANDTWDIGIFAAAVADYKPKYAADQKIKKKEETFFLELVKTKDILQAVGSSKKPHQLLVGFALETEHELEHAQAKLIKKNLDIIVLNSLNDQGAGFQHDTNKITLIDRYNKINDFELKSKKDVAKDLVDYIIQFNTEHVS
jgi:phosphopantothenoylcysteine decarboxylase/phosphopantothenate--cysteine ligase